MVDLKKLINITARKKYASMVRQSFLDKYKDKFSKIKHNEELILLYINSLKKFKFYYTRLFRRNWWKC